MSAWLPGQLYIVADSPKTIADTLPFSLYHAVTQYVRIPEEEHEVVEHSQVMLPNPAWVKIKHDKYKGYIGRVFKSGKISLKSYVLHVTFLIQCLRDVEP